MKGLLPDGADIAGRAGLSLEDVGAGLLALKDEYVDLVTPLGGPAGWHVNGVTGEARRVVGQWPTGESLVERLAAGIAAEAEGEADPERRRRLLFVARELGGMAKAVAVNVASQLLEHRVH